MCSRQTYIVAKQSACIKHEEVIPAEEEAGANEQHVTHQRQCCSHTIKQTFIRGPVEDVTKTELSSLPHQPPSHLL